MSHTRGSPRADLTPLVALCIVSVAVAVSAGHPAFLAEVWGDEFLLPWYGKQILAGRAPYDDFFIFLGPLAAYGSALLERVAGVGVAPFRAANVVVLTLTTLAVHEILRIRRCRRLHALGAALCVPLVVFAVWPMASHQWTAACLALLTLWMIAPESPGRWRFVAAGIACASSGLIVQTMGVLALAALIALLIADRRSWPALGLVVAGLALPVVICTVLLLRDGALGGFVRYGVLWPSDSYVQQGGFNDGSLAFLMQQRPVRTALSDGLVSDRAAHTAILPLAAAGLLLPIGAGLARLVRGRSGVPDIVMAAGACFILLVFDLGRSDLPHLAYVTPGLLVLAAIAARRCESIVVERGLAVVLASALVVGGVRWAGLWWSTPPDPAALVHADDSLRTRIEGATIDRIDDVRAERLPVVYLSRAGAALYTYWSPAFPPVEWIAAPSWGTNTSEQYAWLAAFIEDAAIPFILVDHQDAGIITDPSAVRSMLESRYVRYSTIPAGVVFVRAR